MKARAGTGWQYVMTDLSLILFMITAAALREAPAEAHRPSPLAAPALGEPVAVWRGGADAPGLRQWLASQGADPRQRLTVIAPLRDAAAAVALAQGAGRPARVVLEPDASGAPYAALTYDQSAPLARGLQSSAETKPNPESSP
ncbi:MAG: hypothetical protein ABL926_05725 [Novosphingobium sp.]|uniref:hypothetical protein n=1 Tax=Novosphingobium sp. TaxID=1874826 RepID=UPI0032B866E3